MVGDADEQVQSAGSSRVYSAMSASLLEETVFSKAYFDARACLLGEKDKELVGLALLGFGPTEDGSELDRSTAIISRILIAPEHRNAAGSDTDGLNTDGLNAGGLIGGLLQNVEAYCRSVGAQQLFYGSQFPISPYLAGLYGGELVPGVLAGEPWLLEALAEQQFESVDRVITFENSLDEFRPVVDRAQMMARRNFNVQIEADPNPADWYQAVCFGTQNCVDFKLVDRKNSRLCGNLKFWEIEPLGSQWGRRTAGLYELEIDQEVRRLGLATLLLGDAFRQLADLGFRQVETQVPESNEITCRLFDKLGFNRVGSATQMRRELS